MKINKYPDGSSYYELISNNPKGNYTFKANSYEDLWHLNQLVDAHWNLFREKPIITIPNLIDAQADRRFASNQSSGLKLVCKFLNEMNANFKIFHPHNPEVVEALMDNVEITNNYYFIKEALSEIYCSKHNISRDKGRFYNPDIKDDLILMSSDAGGFKPLMKLCDKIKWKGQTASASKSRLWDGKESRLVQQIQCEDFEGRDILIIDDICVYGGTFKGLSKLLRERNCGKLYLAVSHMTVQDLGIDPVVNYFDKVFTTNSKFDEYRYNTAKTKEESHLGSLFGKPKNLEIIKLF